MANETEAPRNPVRAVVESMMDSGSSRVSEIVSPCNDVAACSVHAEMDRVCCGDKVAWGPCERNSGCMAMLGWDGRQKR